MSTTYYIVKANSGRYVDLIAKAKIDDSDTVIGRIISDDIDGVKASFPSKYGPDYVKGIGLVYKNNKDDDVMMGVFRDYIKSLVR